MTRGKQFYSAAFTTFLLIVIDQCTAKCVRKVSDTPSATAEAQLQTACNRTGGVYYVNNGTGSCYTLVEMNILYPTAQKSCTQLNSTQSVYNAHLAYWRDGAALQLVYKTFIQGWQGLQMFVGEVLVNNQWTNQDANGINGAPFDMKYMCSKADCTDCVSGGIYGAMIVNSAVSGGICMGNFDKGGFGPNPTGMWFICEYENM